MLTRGGSYVLAWRRFIISFLKEGRERLIFLLLLVYILLVDCSMRSLFVIIFSRLWSIHYNIEHIVGVFLPLRWEKWHNIACFTFLLCQYRLGGFFSISEGTRLPVSFDVILHFLIFCSVFFLCKIPMRAENFARERDFIS